MTLTQDRLKELLNYDKFTGKFIRKVNKGSSKAGEEPGYFIAGYRYIMIDGRSYPAHRLVFLYETGIYPNSDVDHKNMIRDDNRFENLRIASRRENMFNTRAHYDSASGIKNVFYRTDTNKYSVRVSVNGRYRSFGCFDDKELAELVANYVREKYHGEYSRGG